MVSAQKSTGAAGTSSTKQDRDDQWGYGRCGVRDGADEATIGVLVMVGGGAVRGVVLTAADDEWQDQGSALAMQPPG